MQIVEIEKLFFISFVDSVNIFYLFKKHPPPFVKWSHVWKIRKRESPSKKQIKKRVFEGHPKP
jgi:hypothetical protein